MHLGCPCSTLCCFVHASVCVNYMKIFCNDILKLPFMNACSKNRVYNKFTKFCNELLLHFLSASVLICLFYLLEVNVLRRLRG